MKKNVSDINRKKMILCMVSRFIATNYKGGFGKKQ